MVSKVIRRIHMYLALFLTPWMLVYAISTLTLNHREFITSFYAERFPPYTKVQEIDYSETFSGDEDNQTIAAHILQDLNLDGARQVRGGDGKPVVIIRRDPVTLKKITYDPEHRTAVYEQEKFRFPIFLQRLHFRRGYRSAYIWNDAWGLSVDIAIFAMMFWCISGVWLWWELKKTRKWGTVSIASGAALFVLFLILI